MSHAIENAIIATCMVDNLMLALVCHARRSRGDQSYTETETGPYVRRILLRLFSGLLSGIGLSDL